MHARRGGAEVVGWTLDRKIRVRFPAYPHRLWALWWQGGKRRLRTFRCLCRGRLGTLKTPICPWRGCLAAGQNLETGHLSRHYIAEISRNVTLNHNQQQQQTYISLCLFAEYNNRGRDRGYVIPAVCTEPWTPTKNAPTRKLLPKSKSVPICVSE